MRSSRLLALLLALQRTGSATSPALARELEVSVRTIYRDVAALQAAGVPIYTTTGPGGGVHLLDTWRSPIGGMTADEVRALVVGGGAAGDLGLGAVLAVARSKLRSGLPAPLRDEIDTIGERFHVDAAGWFRPAESAEHLADLARAVWEDQRADISYVRGGRTVRRRVDPLGLVLKAGRWYLVARHRGSIRTYRVSRVSGVRVRTERFERPAGFVLTAHWEESAEGFDRDIRPLEVELLVPADARRALVGAVPGVLTGRAVEAAEVAPDGRLRVLLPVEDVAVATDQLIGVPEVEVVRPPELRRALRRRAEQLAARNAG